MLCSRFFDLYTVQYNGMKDLKNSDYSEQRAQRARRKDKILFVVEAQTTQSRGSGDAVQ
jgi:hypothetical protein